MANPRINVTFEESTTKLLIDMAGDHKAVARLVRELTLEALEMHEDHYLSELAEKLDKKGAKTYEHSTAWK